MKTMFTGAGLAVVLLALAGRASPARAQQPMASSLAALVAEAEATNPELAAARKAAEAAAARVPQAGALDDPMLSLGVANLPVTDPRLGQDFMTMTMLGISETFPYPGKRGLREAIARAWAESAQYEAEAIRQKVVAEVKTAYYELYFLERALEVTRRNDTLLAGFSRVTSAKYSVGTAAQPDVLKSQVEQTRLTDQIVSLERRRTTTIARMNALRARPAADTLRASRLPEAILRMAVETGEQSRLMFTSAALSGAAGGGGIPSVPELERLALENNPRIRAHVRRIEGLERTRDLAQKARLPDFRVSIGYAQRSGFRDMVSAAVALPLPVFAGRKQNQQVIEQSAALAEAEAQHRSMVDRINADIASLAAELASARTQIVLLNDGILPQARASLASAGAAYRVGQVDLLALLDAQVTLYRDELDHPRLLRDFAVKLAALERAVGKEILQ